MNGKKSISTIVGRRLYILYLVSLAIAIALLIRVGNIQRKFIPDKKIESIVTPVLAALTMGRIVWMTAGRRYPKEKTIQTLHVSRIGRSLR